MKDYHVNIFYSDEDGGYIADIPDLEACSAFGATRAEALAELETAKTAWLEAARAENKLIPEPHYPHETLDIFRNFIEIFERDTRARVTVSYVRNLARNLYNGALAGRQFVSPVPVAPAGHGHRENKARSPAVKAIREGHRRKPTI